jgi:hypothetical protein
MSALLGMREHALRGSWDRELVRRSQTTSPLLNGSDLQQDPRLARPVSEYRQGQFAAALRAWRELGIEPESHFETLLVAESAAQTGDDACLQYLERLRAFDPVDALFVDAIYHHTKGDALTATKLLVRGFEQYRQWPWADSQLVTRSAIVAEMIIRTGDEASVLAIERAFLEPFAAAQAEDRRRFLLTNSAKRLEKGGCGPRTIAALLQFEPDTPWTLDYLKIRARCYGQVGHPLAALAKTELESFVAREPEAFGSNFEPVVRPVARPVAKPSSKPEVTPTN